MKLILEKLDSELFTEEIKKELTEAMEAQIEVQVELKSAEKAKELVESKEAEYEAYMLSEMQEMETKLEDKLDNYLTQVVESFVTDNKIAIEGEIKKEQYNAVLEGFQSLLIATGVEVTEIVDAKADITVDQVTESKDALAQANEANDVLIEQVKVLKEQNEEMLKIGLVNEKMETLNVVEKEKFVALAETIEFDVKNPSKFMAQLDAIKVAVTGAVVESKEIIEKDVKADDIVKEVIVEKVVTAPTDKLYQTSAKHLY